MALSKELLKDFAKITNDRKKGPTETFVFGQARKVGNAYYVKFDGAEIFTPVASTVDVRDGDRVMVLIKNHTGTITSNVTSNPVSQTTFGEFQNVIEADFVKTEYLQAEYITADSIEARYASIDTLQANYITAQEIATTYLTAQKIETTYLTAQEIAAEYATIRKLEADYITANDIYTKYLDADQIAARYATINQLTSDYITTAQIDAAYAKIDLANVAQGSIKTYMLGQGVVGTAQIADGSITDAKIVGLTANKITSGTIDAGNIEVVNLNAANITVGTINGQQIANGAIGTNQLADASITDAKLVSLSASKITTGTIDASDIEVINLKASNITVGTINGSQIAPGAIDTSNLSQQLNDNIGGSVTNVIVMYALSDSQSEAPVSGWSAVAPEWEDGKFMWQKTTKAYTNGRIVESAPTCISGATGPAGSSMLSSMNLALGTMYDKAVYGATGESLLYELSYKLNELDLTTEDSITLSCNWSADDVPTGAAFSIGIDVEGVTYLLIDDDGAFIIDDDGVAIDVDDTYFSFGLTQLLQAPILDNEGLPLLDNNGDEITDSFAREGGSYVRTLPVTEALLNSSADRLKVRFLNANGAFFRVSELKFEIGDHATHYFPALEDFADTVQEKTASFFQPNPPAGEHAIGDIWFDTDDGNQIYNWNGAVWQAQQYGSNALAANSVTAEKLVAGSVTTAKIEAGAITAQKIATGTITAAQIATGTITATQIATGTITAEKLKTGLISADYLAANAVTAGKIAANAVTTDKIDAGAITAAKIAAGTIEASNIKSGTITTKLLSTGLITADYLAAGSVTSDKIVANAITAAKIATADVFANSAVLTEIFSHSITASGTITGGTFVGGLIKSSNYAAASSGNYASSGMCVDLTNSQIRAVKFAVVGGNLYAKGGQIGRYNITDTYLYVGTGANQVGIGGAQAFWAGSESSNAAPFRVSYAGALVATNVDIQGKITASSGFIGRYTIGTNALTAGSGATAVGLGGDQAFWAGSATANSAPFRVSYAGALVTTNIKATGGLIGRLSVSPTSLTYSSSSASALGIGGSTMAFWAGSTTETAGNFYVSYGGVMYAKNATLNDATVTNGLNITGSLDFTGGAVINTTADGVTINSDEAGTALTVYGDTELYGVNYAWPIDTKNALRAVLCTGTGNNVIGRIWMTSSTVIRVSSYAGGSEWKTYLVSASSSDIRLKHNVQDTEVSSALSVIEKLPIRSFDWNEDDRHQKIGFIADELDKIDEMFTKGGGVDEDGRDVYKSIDTLYMLGYVVKAIQELKKEIDILKGEQKA